MLSKEGEIRRDEACFDYSGGDIVLYPCHGSKGNQLWEYNHEVIHLNINYSVHLFMLDTLILDKGPRGPVSASLTRMLVVRIPL